jgi:hypothetical protein
MGVIWTAKPIQDRTPFHPLRVGNAGDDSVLDPEAPLRQ